MVPFNVFCGCLNGVKSRTKKELKKSHLKNFIEKWRESEGDCFPVLRLLLPELDRQRATYGLKEQKLASIYIKVLGLDPNSPDAQALVNYKDPGKNRGIVGDFTLKLQSLLRYRMPQSITSQMSVEDVNAKLDELSRASTADQREMIIRYFFSHCTLIEQVWIVRIILKDLDLGMTESSILPLYHEDAFKYFQVCADLKQLCIDLSNPNFHMEKFSIRLFCPFAPQLSKRIEGVEGIPKEVGGALFWMETKLDGERIQLHFEEGKFEWWSRNTKDYTSMYGSDWNSGSLVPQIRGNFAPVVKNCILDGEMLAFNTITKTFEPFGSLKTASNEALAQQENAVRHPCFVAFDIVFFNGQSLIDEPLSLRYQYLLKVLNENTDYIQVLPHQTGYTEQDILDALDERMVKGEEGIIIKDPSACYVPNERTNSVKLKAEYISELSDDIDLVIVGGYFGQGRHRSGQLGSFLCAIRDDTKPEPHFVSFCKFGTGFTMDELPKISMFEQGNWKRYSPDLRLPWFTHVQGKENPDFYIEPRHSQVVQIRGSEIVPSVSFGAGYTLRFPRFVSLRHDKGYQDIMTSTELVNYIDINKGRMQRKRAIADEHAPAKKRTKTNTVKVLPTFSGVKNTNFEQSSNIFEQKEFCTRINGSIEEKQKIESLIIENGGTVTQNPTKNTHLIICDKINVQIKSFIKGGKYDIAKPSYIYECVEETVMVPLREFHTLYATEATKSTFKKFSDIYGDSYIDPVTPDSLKMLFEGMVSEPVPSFQFWQEGPMFDQYMERKKLITEILYEYFTEKTWCIFPGSVFYLDSSPTISISKSLKVVDTEQWSTNVLFEADQVSFAWNFLACEIRAYGGVVLNTIAPQTTHILLSDRTRAAIFRALNAKLPSQKRIVLSPWISQCISNKSMIDETRFAC